MRQAEPIIKIPGKYTKNKKPHTIPLYHPELRAMVAAARTHRNPDCPFLFQHRGKQLKDMRSGFEKARKDVGLDGTVDGVGKVIFHDTRRTAVTFMDEIGIDREDAMEMTGHLTESMYKRYRIGKASKAVATGQKLREATVNQSKFANRFANDACGPQATSVS